MRFSGSEGSDVLIGFCEVGLGGNIVNVCRKEEMS
jgi:hypothetical protein